MSVSYITAGDGQFQEIRRTVSNHLLKGLHIQTKILEENAMKMFFCCIFKTVHVLFFSGSTYSLKK